MLFRITEAPEKKETNRRRGKTTPSSRVDGSDISRVEGLERNKARVLSSDVRTFEAQFLVGVGFGRFGGKRDV